MTKACASRYRRPPGFAGGGSTVSSEVTAWGRQHGTAVEESDYSSRTSTDSGNDSESSSRSGQSAVHRLDASDVS
ncbi:hypothetical protein ABZ613_18200 [Streptomyces collinus]|uniref:hypothetical protein n=1 Tax=Streptomyces collinus TaxID=42684 RepID=UPI0033C3A565